MLEVYFPHHMVKGRLPFSNEYPWWDSTANILPNEINKNHAGFVICIAKFPLNISNILLATRHSVIL